MQKKTLIIDNIPTPYIISRYNAINTVLDNNLEVWFQNKSDVNRQWKNFPKANYRAKYLKDLPIRFFTSDIYTIHINFQILNLLKKNKQHLDNVIICGWDSFTYLMTIIFCLQHKIPFTLWSGSTHFENSWRRKLFLPYIKWVVSSASKYIAYGTRAKDFLITLGAKESQITIFFNSVDVDYFKDQHSRLLRTRKSERSKLNIKQSSFVILYVGQLIDRKGIKDLMNAFRIFSKTTTATLLFVGSGKLRKELESHSIKDVFFFNHVQYYELPKFYLVADCLVLPSREEVWGLVVNEALASNVPVIVSNAVGCTPDLVDPNKTGYSYESGNVHDLTQKLSLMFKKRGSFSDLFKFVAKTDPKLQAAKIF